ncbi:MAG: COX15/CtaA family protein [Chitinophagaceae bacterium]
MESLQISNRSRPVAIWLMTGVLMILVQVLLGGITRLTGSGLSITQWDPIMGALPPLNHSEWIRVFYLYQQTPQYHILHPDFTLHQFKSIFFWEYVHRLWARLLGLVFILFFVLFLIQKRFNRSMIRPMIILFLLGGLQALIGWVMVESGLVGDNVRVNHFKLAIHFMGALILLCYTFWFALRLLVRPQDRIVHPGLKKLTAWILGVLTLQLIYGAFMAGLHAALSAPTWPDINGYFIPGNLLNKSSIWLDFTSNPILVQLIHRGLAYTLLVLIGIWWWKARKADGSKIWVKSRSLPLIAVLLQIILGILTVIHSTVHIPVFLGVAHQLGALLLLLVMVWMLSLLQKKPTPG